MTFLQNQAITAQPNVLGDQTVPNTLSGVGAPKATARQRTTSASWVLRLGALLVVVLGLLGIVTRLG